MFLTVIAEAQPMASASLAVRFGFAILKPGFKTLVPNLRDQVSVSEAWFLEQRHLRAAGVGLRRWNAFSSKPKKETKT